MVIGDSKYHHPKTMACRDKDDNGQPLTIMCHRT
jgi:hypothetical protein